MSLSQDNTWLFQFKQFLVYIKFACRFTEIATHPFVLQCCIAKRVSCIYIQIYKTPEGLHAVHAIVTDPQGQMQTEICSIRSKLEEKCGCDCTQLSLRDIFEYGKLLNGQLRIKLPGWNNEQIVSVAYLRSGYTVFENSVEQQ